MTTNSERFNKTINELLHDRFTRDSNPQPEGEATASPPLTIPPITIAQASPHPLDEFITRTLLDQCLKGDFYKCARCNFSTVDPALMISHLADEINAAVASLATIPEQRKPK